MPTIDELIKQEINPFDPSTSRAGNFWYEEPNPFPVVNSIHQEVIEEIRGILQQIQRDRTRRTVLLRGDTGSGKSYLLGRLKKELKTEGFFVYVDPWINGDSIWRHTLRCIIDSLTCTPEGEEDSQLISWLKDLVARSTDQTNRKTFISNMKAAHPSVKWNPSVFFGMLYSLTQPDLYPIACEWLRGDELDDDSLKQLKTKTLVNTEEMAQNLIKNLGVVAASTKPIIICFDQPGAAGSRNPDGTVDLQPLLSLNTMLHNQKSNNFLIIISVVTDVWRQQRLEEPDLARIDNEIQLKKINLEQAKALWESRLYPLHKKATEQPKSSIYPLTEEDLNNNFPSGQTRPREVLKVGEKLIRGGKVDTTAAFKVAWHDQYNNLTQQVQGIRQYSSEQLINMLQIALECLNIQGVENRIFDGKTRFNAHSISYLRNNSEKIGVIWNEEPNLRTFSALMRVIDRLNHTSRFQKLYLIRQEGIGQPQNKGYKIFKGLFQNRANEHIIPTLESVLYLATYREFYKSATIKELSIGDEIPDVSRLQELTCQSDILNKCDLLQKLVNSSTAPPTTPPLDEIKDFLVTTVQTQLFIGRKVLTDKTLAEFGEQTNLEALDRAIESLDKEQHIKIVNPQQKPEKQSICLPIQNQKK